MNNTHRFTVIYIPEKKHECGLIKDFPKIPVGSIVECNKCNRLWKRRKNYYDGQLKWTWKHWWESKNAT